MLKRVLKLSLLIGAVVMMLLQLVPVDHTNPVSEENLDFLVVTQANEKVSNLVKVACYDCHSHKTEHPWYSFVAPVSFYIEHHIEEGRDELNFSKWGEYSEKRADHKLEECVELIEEGEMPMESYVLLHSEADLSDDDKETLIAFFESLRVRD